MSALEFRRERRPVFILGDRPEDWCSAMMVPAQEVCWHDGGAGGSVMAGVIASA